jgi:hypothetical protein
MISSPDFFTIPDFASWEDPHTSGHIGNFAASSNLCPTPLSQKRCCPIWHWLHTRSQQSQVLEFGRTARWSESQHQPQSLLLILLYA